MCYQLKIPARINLLGNPGDANEGDFAVLGMAVDIYASATIAAADDICFEGYESGTTQTPFATYRYPVSEIPLPYGGELDLIAGAINRLHSYSAEFREKIRQGGFNIAIRSDVPRQSGLGGSSLFIQLTLAGLRAFYQLNPLKHNDYILAELTQQVESLELGIACGFADRYLPVFGGIAYMDFRGKAFHHGLNNEPLATIENLTPFVESIPLVAVSSGILHNSGSVHGVMRPKYLQEYNQWMQSGGEMPPMVRFMSAAWETAWKGKYALLQDDLPTVGQQMVRNHQIVDEMMTYCGFSDGAGWANNLLIDTAMQNGALGAKLTGAGGGGSVFALTHPGEEERVMDAWQNIARIHDLTNATIYQPRVSSGLTVEQI